MEQPQFHLGMCFLAQVLYLRNSGGLQLQEVGI